MARRWSSIGDSPNRPTANRARKLFPRALPPKTLRPISVATAELSEWGSIKGSLAYMSPEQASGNPEAVGPPSDVYCLGATLYKLLTGVAPFSGHDLLGLIERIRAGQFTPPRAIHKEIPPPLEAICLKAMHREPQERYATRAGIGRGPRALAGRRAGGGWREPWAAQPALAAQAPGADDRGGRGAGGGHRQPDDSLRRLGQQEQRSGVGQQEREGGQRQGPLRTRRRRETARSGRGESLRRRHECRLAGRPGAEFRPHARGARRPSAAAGATGFPRPRMVYALERIPPRTVQRPRAQRHYRIARLFARRKMDRNRRDGHRQCERPGDCVECRDRRASPCLLLRP